MRLRRFSHQTKVRCSLHLHQKVCYRSNVTPGSVYRPDVGTKAIVQRLLFADKQLFPDKLPALRSAVIEFLQAQIKSTHVEHQSLGAYQLTFASFERRVQVLHGFLAGTQLFLSPLRPCWLSVCLGWDRTANPCDTSTLGLTHFAYTQLWNSVIGSLEKCLGASLSLSTALKDEGSRADLESLSKLLLSLVQTMDTAIRDGPSRIQSLQVTLCPHPLSLLIMLTDNALGLGYSPCNS